MADSMVVVSDTSLSHKENVIVNPHTGFVLRKLISRHLSKAHFQSTGTVKSNSI